MQHLARLLEVVAVLLVLAALCAPFLAEGDNELELELCMGCICEATTNCNLTIHCTRGLCGPFLISDIYWKEAGRPVINGDNSARQGGVPWDHNCVEPVQDKFTWHEILVPKMQHRSRVWEKVVLSFYRCVTEPYCAANTVRHYLAKYAQDCNADGTIDCDDYARIHYMGGRQCFIDIQHLGYYNIFKECERSVQELIA